MKIYTNKALSKEEVETKYNKGIGDMPATTFEDWVKIENKWHHIVMSWDGVSAKTYVNGELSDNGSL